MADRFDLESDPYRYFARSEEHVDRSWMDDANCRSTDPDAFFSDQGVTKYQNLVKQVCESCPVKAECLEEALSLPGRVYGIWGGLPAWKVEEVRSKRRRAAA